MSSKELATIEQFKYLAEQGYITPRELDWCVGAIRNRHGLSRETRQKLKQTVQVVLDKARTRIDKDQK